MNYVIMIMPHRPMSSTERVRNFRARHGLSRVNIIGGLKLTGVRPPAPPARRARKAKPMMQTLAEIPAQPAPLPLMLPAPVETIEIPGMTTIDAIPAPQPVVQPIANPIAA
jgi:hypothetical protein